MMSNVVSIGVGVNVEFFQLIKLFTPDRLLFTNGRFVLRHKVNESAVVLILSIENKKSNGQLAHLTRTIQQADFLHVVKQVVQITFKKNGKTNLTCIIHQAPKAFGVVVDKASRKWWRKRTRVR